MNNYTINCYYYKKELKAFSSNKESSNDINIGSEKKRN